MHEQLTRRDALVAALAAATLGSGALLRPASARAATATARIGVIMPLAKSVDFGAGGNVLKTAQLWRDWVNSHGGVDGQQVELKVYDDKMLPERGVQNLVHAVKQDHCSVILAGWASAVAQAESEQAHALGVPMFVSYAWSVDITKANYPEVVRIGPNNEMLPKAFAPFFKQRGYREVAIIADDTAFAQSLGGTIRASSADAGIDMRAHTFKRDTRDLRGALKALLAAKPNKPDALVITANPYIATRYTAIQQARAVGYKGDIVLGWDYLDDAFWKATGKAGVGVIWPTFSAPMLHLTPTGTAFKKLFTKRYKRAPLIYQALTWDQLNAWKWAVDTVGSTAPSDVVPALPRIDMQGTQGHITLSNQPGTLHFNQWEGVTVYFDQATKLGATDSNAKVLAGISAQTK
jgi:branched-chain amino acid transport system substrate-binding protein